MKVFAEKRLSPTLALTAALVCLSGSTSAEEPPCFEESCPSDQLDESKARTNALVFDGVACADDEDRSSGGRQQEQSSDDDQSNDGPDPSAAEQQSEEEVTSASESPFAVHGYFTLAYANGTGRRLFGVTDRGTFDYGTAAFQFRYAPGDKHNFVVQIANERLGESPIARETDAIELDWIFYQYQLTDSTSFRFGRVPIPHGIYSEIRDVGTLLPFYRPPAGLYFEGGFAAEALNGVVVTQRLATESDWPIELDIYGGEWGSLEYDFTVDLVNKAHIDNGVGAQFWIETPLPSLRLGVGAMRYDMNDAFIIQGSGTDLQLSLDGEFGRLRTRAEYRNAGLPPGDFEAFYVELGARVSSRLSLFTQFSSADIVIQVEGYPDYNGDYSDDFAVGVNYRLFSQVVLKVENHWYRGWAPGADGDIFHDPFPEKGEQLFLVSASLSF